MIEWIGEGLEFLELKINNKTIGVLEYYNDCDEDYGWRFVWLYGIMKYEFDAEYFSVGNKMIWHRIENVKSKVLIRVKDVLGFEYLGAKHLYDVVDKSI